MSPKHSIAVAVASVALTLALGLSGSVIASDDQDITGPSHLVASL